MLIGSRWLLFLLQVRLALLEPTGPAGQSITGPTGPDWGCMAQTILERSGNDPVAGIGADAGDFYPELSDFVFVWP